MNANLFSTTEPDYNTSASNTLSLYAVTWDMDMAAYFSSNPVGVSGTPVPIIADQNDGSNFMFKRFKWYVGFAPQQPRCIARLRYLKNALS